MRFYRSAAVVLPLIASWGLVEACTNSSTDAETQADASKEGTQLPLELVRGQDCSTPAQYKGELSGQILDQTFPKTNANTPGDNGLVPFTIEQGKDASFGDPKKRFILSFEIGTGDEAISCRTVFITTTKSTDTKVAGQVVKSNETTPALGSSNTTVTNYTTLLSLYKNLNDFVCKSKQSNQDYACTFATEACSEDAIEGNAACTGGDMTLNRSIVDKNTRNLRLKLAGTCAPATKAGKASTAASDSSNSNTSAATKAKSFYLTLKSQDTYDKKMQQKCVSENTADRTAEGKAGAAGAAGASGAAGSAGAKGTAGKAGAAGSSGTAGKAGAAGKAGSNSTD